MPAPNLYGEVGAIKDMIDQEVVGALLVAKEAVERVQAESMRVLPPEVVVGAGATAAGQLESIKNTLQDQIGIAVFIKEELGKYQGGIYRL